MSNATPVTNDGPNRRENFRIDNVLPLSLRKVQGATPPAAHIIPIAAEPGEVVTDGTMISSFGEPSSTLTLMLIEIRAKLDLLLETLHPNRQPDTSPTLLSLGQVAAQINVKVDQVLGLKGIARSDERLQVESINLSAGGLKLMTDEPLEANDLVEVRLFINDKRPFWIVAGGTVVRSQPLPTGRREVAITFTDLNERVSDELSRYALMCQKKQIIARRGGPF